jgi:hypothetical protein
MGYQITRPEGDQLNFVSSKTGSHVLDQYLEDAERGTKSLGDLIDLLFDAAGNLRALVTVDEIVSVVKGGTGGNSQATAQAGLDVPSRTGAGATGTWNITASGNVARTSATGTALVPVGTTAQRDGTPQIGVRYNTTLSQFEGYNGTTWGGIGGGATGGGPDKVFILNDQVVNNDYTIPVGQNAVTAGPVSIASGKVVTISPGSTWSVV